MPIKKILDRLPGDFGGGIQVRVYECTECGNTFESAKQPGRAECMECFTQDVEVVGTANS